MDQTLKAKNRKETRILYRHGLRRAKAVADYLLLAATEQHREATEFVIKLEQKYPNKKDIRKTDEYREWQKKQVSLLANNNNIAIGTSSQIPDQIPHYTDIRVNETPSTTQSPQHTDTCINQEKELVLRIPLMSTNTTTKDLPTPDIPVEDEQAFSIFNEIPPHVMDEIMAEIRSDPNLNAIMNEFDVHEEVIEEGNVFDIDLDIDIDIDIGDPLQDELNRIL